MMRKTFMITLDLLPSLDLDGLREYVKTSSLFENWWNHIGAFLVVSDRRADAISEAVKRYTRSARMLVIEANPAESEGWLSERGWKWIRRRSQEAAEQPATQ